MSTRIWERAKEKQFRYERRIPEQTDLYRLVYHNIQDLEYRWDELFREQYGILRHEVLETFNEFLDCGILRHGCALACCEQCDHFKLIAFSCSKRGVCASCMAKRAVVAAEHLHQNILLPHPHTHTTLTIPKRIRQFFKFNRKLNKHLYWSAWRAWKSYVNKHLPGGKPAAVMALHSFGDHLEWHPHLHILFLLGTLDDDGSFHELEHVDTDELEKLFADNLLEYLRQEDLLTEDDIENMQLWPHSGFSVFCGEAISADDTDHRLFAARYLAKAPISSERLELDESGLIPVVRYRKILDDIEQVEEFSPLQFLAPRLRSGPSSPPR